MITLYELASRAARTTLPVLILGETGSGKELVARAVHTGSERAGLPFKPLNCATIPSQLTESVLFGHERGAFTGAERQVAGIFEQAKGGTVLLDEIGELPPQAQAALLRVLEQQRLVRVGGTVEVGVDVRVIAATHRDLSAMAATGAFREDLLYRLDAFRLTVPPLRERREEILPLAELFLKRASTDWGAEARRFSHEASVALGTYGWPGNVRQLKNVVERAVSVSTGETIEQSNLPEHVLLVSHTAEGPPSRPGFISLPDRVRMLEIGLIRDALAVARGNQAEAARLLGVPRRTLANKVQSYSLSIRADGSDPPT
jgi:two-component system response regulator AtoC